jgi:hypothetical protein
LPQHLASGDAHDAPSLTHIARCVRFLPEVGAFEDDDAGGIAVGACAELAAGTAG